MTRSLRIALLAFSFGLAGLAAAQETGQGVQIGSGFRQDPSLPVEITSDALTVDQSAATATFAGSVLAVQGQLRVTADEALVEYARDTNAMSRLTATGSVVLTTPTEAAEAARAVYDLTASRLVLDGNVLLTQGFGAISGERLTIDLAAGTARMEGRVRTVFKPGETGQAPGAANP
jgi:lipopolysaccharide export system protein LptA